MYSFVVSILYEVVIVFIPCLLYAVHKKALNLQNCVEMLLLQQTSIALVQLVHLENQVWI